MVWKYQYDVKNAAHLIRLLRMGTEFLETGRLQVYRTTDADELKVASAATTPLVERTEKVWHAAPASGYTHGMTMPAAGAQVARLTGTVDVGSSMWGVSSFTLYASE